MSDVYVIKDNQTIFDLSNQLYQTIDNVNILLDDNDNLDLNKVYDDNRSIIYNRVDNEISDSIDINNYTFKNHDHISYKIADSSVYNKGFHNLSTLFPLLVNKAYFYVESQNEYGYIESSTIISIFENNTVVEIRELVY